MDSVVVTQICNSNIHNITLRFVGHTHSQCIPCRFFGCTCRKSLLGTRRSRISRSNGTFRRRGFESGPLPQYPWVGHFRSRLPALIFCKSCIPKNWCPHLAQEYLMSFTFFSKLARKCFIDQRSSTFLSSAHSLESSWITKTQT